jgi:hypothetical protein
LESLWDERWFGAGANPELCGHCREAASCPRQFAYRPSQHKTLLERLPLPRATVHLVLQQVRPWIEHAQPCERTDADSAKFSSTGSA